MNYTHKHIKVIIGSMISEVNEQIKHQKRQKSIYKSIRDWEGCLVCDGAIEALTSANFIFGQTLGNVDSTKTYTLTDVRALFHRIKTSLKHELKHVASRQKVMKRDEVWSALIVYDGKDEGFYVAQSIVNETLTSLEED